VEKLKAAVSPFIPVRIKRLLLATVLFDRPSKLALRAFGSFEMAFRKNTADEAVLAESFEHDELLTGIPEYHAAPNHTIIDVGAHIGAFSILAASKVPEGRVYAVEASADTYSFLRINVALNRAANVTVCRVALLDRRGECNLSHDWGNWGHSAVKKLSRRSETVPCCTLADFLREHNIEHCDLIKFNCEGAEFPILLSSSSDTLQKFSRMLVLYHCDLWRQNSEADLIRRLEDAGFRCDVRNQSDKRGWIFATKAGI
jgi:FkbM family methyltransferase